MIEVSIAHDEHFNALGEFSQLLFLRILPHTDDVGRFSGNPKVVKARAYPMSETPVKKFAEAIAEIIEYGILSAYEAEGDMVLQLKSSSFKRINAVLVKNSDGKSEYPDNPSESFLSASEYLTTWQSRAGHVLARDIESRKQRVESNKQKVESKEGEIPKFEEPEVQKAWEAWIEYRRTDKKKAVTPSMAREQFEWLRKQPDPGGCIRQSIRNGWQGLFELKENGNGRRTGKGGVSFTAEDIERETRHLLATDPN